MMMMMMMVMMTERGSETLELWWFAKKGRCSQMRDFPRLSTALFSCVA